MLISLTQILPLHIFSKSLTSTTTETVTGLDSIAIAAISIFVLGYVLITMERKFNSHKSAVALTMGGVLWLLVGISLKGDESRLDEAVHGAGAEIFSIIAFLLAAMTLIEILVHYRLFDFIRAKLLRLKIGDRQQFLLLMVMTFFMSAGLDNIAITIAMLQIARRFFSGRNLAIAAAGVVVAANAGGAWSPIGDTTTILLWLAEKFSATQVIMYAFLPSLALAITAIGLMYRKLDDTNFEKREAGDLIRLSSSEKLVVITATASFTLPLVLSTLGLPPYMGLLLGLGITWSIIELSKRPARNAQSQTTHLTANIEKLLESLDMASIKYLMGILLSVTALSTLGVLRYLSESAIGTHPTEVQQIGSLMGLGFLSSIVDNASLVAIAIDAIPISSPNIWGLAAVSAGNGGSLLLIGSAAGVIAAGTIKELSFGTYLKVATIPVLCGLLVSFAVWYLQYTYIF